MYDVTCKVKHVTVSGARRRKMLTPYGELKSYILQKRERVSFASRTLSVRRIVYDMSFNRRTVLSAGEKQT